MHKIKTFNKIAEAGLKRFPAEHYEVGPEIENPEAIVLRSASLHDMTIPESLTAVGRAGAGVNNIPVDAMSQRGIPVFNAPGANANAVKELVVAGMFMSARSLCEAWEYVRDLDAADENFDKTVEEGKKQFKGFELPGRTLGVIGLGAIGVQVANAAKALGMKVIGYDPHMTVEGAWQLHSEVSPAASLEELLGQADFVTVHIPLNDATRDFLGTERINLLKDSAIVLNFARGGIVDEQAVVDALNERKLAYYVTDFPSPTLKGHHKVLALPHLGASTYEAEENCAVMVANQVRDYLEHGVVRNSVNFPSMRLKRQGSRRLCVVNNNVPDMVGQVSHILGKAKLNIAHMRNESKGNLAYTVIDIDGEVPEETVTAVQDIDGVIRVRLLAE